MKLIIVTAPLIRGPDRGIIRSAAWEKGWISCCIGAALGKGTHRILELRELGN